jgi:hypothetical protein
MANEKIIKTTIEGETCEITCSETGKTLSFKDNTGGLIMFIKGKHGITVVVNDAYKYDKGMVKKYPNLKGINPYLLVPEQINMFITWYFLDTFDEKDKKK